MSNYTTEMLAQLEAAIATGAKEVYYGDKRVSYRSIDEMLRVRDIMKSELGLNTTKKLQRFYPTFDKGL